MHAPSSPKPFPLPPVRTVGLVAAGGAVGGLGRAAIGTWAPTGPGAFPWATFTENVVGALLLALILTLLVEGVVEQPWIRPLLGTGMLGAFTTFATLSYELQRLLTEGHLGTAAGYASSTVAAGFVAAFAGIALARLVAGRRRRP